MLFFFISFFLLNVHIAMFFPLSGNEDQATTENLRKFLCLIACFPFNYGQQHSFRHVMDVWCACPIEVMVISREELSAQHAVMGVPPVLGYEIRESGSWVVKLQVIEIFVFFLKILKKFKIKKNYTKY